MRKKPQDFTTRSHYKTARRIVIDNYGKTTDEKLRDLLVDAGVRRPDDSEPTIKDVANFRYSLGYVKRRLVRGKRKAKPRAVRVPMIRQMQLPIETKVEQTVAPVLRLTGTDDSGALQELILNANIPPKTKLELLKHLI